MWTSSRSVATPLCSTASGRVISRGCWGARRATPLPRGPWTPSRTTPNSAAPLPIRKSRTASSALPRTLTRRPRPRGRRRRRLAPDSPTRTRTSRPPRIRVERRRTPSQDRPRTRARVGRRRVPSQGRPRTSARVRTSAPILRAAPYLFLASPRWHTPGSCTSGTALSAVRRDTGLACTRILGPAPSAPGWRRQNRIRPTTALAYRIKKRVSPAARAGAGGSSLGCE